MSGENGAAPKKSAVLLISGGVFLVALLSVLILRSIALADATPSASQTNLPALLQLEMENEQLATENARLWQELTQLQNSQNATTLTSEQLETEKINAALLAMTGPGLTITLDDSQEVRENASVNYVIHEEYLRQIVNVLWSGGAEAIAINDQRLTGQSEIFCSGAFIQINGTRQSPPYRIVVLGSQSDLRAALQFYFWDQLGHYQQQYGITREMEISETPLTVPAAKSRTFRYAETVKEGAAS
jgi:uncharacterized protein YlxW (UPF0749 family)